MKRIPYSIRPAHISTLHAQYRYIETELRQRESELRSLVDSQTAYLLRTDMEGRYTYVNHRYAERFSFIEPNMIGKNSMESILQEDHTATITAVQACLAYPGTPVQVTLRKPSPEGGMIWTDWEFVTVHNRSGDTEIQCVGFDVTLRKQAEEMLRQRDIMVIAMKKDLELQEVKTRMMRYVAHELRTPLAIIQLSVDLLSSYSKLMTEEKQQEKLATIHYEVNRLKALVGDVTRLLSEDVQQLPVKHPHRVNIPILIHTIVERMRLLNLDARIFNVDADGDWWMMGDPELIESMITNLISNALKYSPPQSAIDISASIEDGMIVLIVCDHGIGIAESEIEHICEPFYRGDNTQDVPGVGLGMSIVQYAVKAHHGTIHVKSSLGVGTTFTILLPDARQIG